MSGLNQFIMLGSLFAVFFLPSVIVGVGIWLTGIGEAAIKQHRRLFFLLVCALASLIGLALLIWFNPYGREINSSLPAFGMLPVFVASAVLCLEHWREIGRMCQGNRVLLVLLVVLFPLGFILLWLAEATTFYVLMGLIVLLFLVRQAAMRLGLFFQTLISLTCVGCVFLGGGGAFFTLGLDHPYWLREGLPAAVVIALWVSVFLAAALLYSVVEGKRPFNRWKTSLQLFLIGLLITGIAYRVYWDGIWSSAHARAFEDHLPLLFFLFCLAAGILLTFALHGWRKWLGAGYVILVTAICLISLSLGWQVSAFELTEQRAAKVNDAVLRYFGETGRYPDSLDELTPGYLLYLPPPVVVRQGDWCYQASASGYGFGYITGQFTYSEAIFGIAIYAHAGDITWVGETCEGLLKLLQARVLNY